MDTELALSCSLVHSLLWGCDGKNEGMLLARTWWTTSSGAIIFFPNSLANLSTFSSLLLLGVPNHVKLNTKLRGWEGCCHTRDFTSTRKPLPPIHLPKTQASKPALVKMRFLRSVSRRSCCSFRLAVKECWKQTNMAVAVGSGSGEWQGPEY